MHTQQLIHIGNATMLGAAVLSSSAFLAAFVFKDELSIAQQILGHIGFLIGPLFLKLGYVMRLNGQRHELLHSGVPVYADRNGGYSHGH